MLFPLRCSERRKNEREKRLNEPRRGGRYQPISEKGLVGAGLGKNSRKGSFRGFRVLPRTCRRFCLARDTRADRTRYMLSRVVIFRANVTRRNTKIAARVRAGGGGATVFDWRATRAPGFAPADIPARNPINRKRLFVRMKKSLPRGSRARARAFADARARARADKPLADRITGRDTSKQKWREFNIPISNPVDICTEPAPHPRSRASPLRLTSPRRGHKDTRGGYVCANVLWSARGRENFNDVARISRAKKHLCAGSRAL